MKIKSRDLINTAIFAASSTLGSIIAIQVVNGVRGLSDPYEKARIKQKCRKIKTRLFNKNES